MCGIHERFHFLTASTSAHIASADGSASWPVATRAMYSACSACVMMLEMEATSEPQKASPGTAGGNMPR